MDVGIFGHLVDIGHIALGLEQAPQRGQINSSGDNGILLYVEVAGIVPSTNGKARNVFQWFVLGVVFGSLTIAIVNLNIGWGHDGIVHIGAAMPYSIAFVHFHVVHGYNQRYVHRGMPLVGIDFLVDREGVGLYAVVFDDVKSGFVHLGKVDAGIVVAAIEYAPFFYLGVQGQCLSAIGIDT